MTFKSIAAALLATLALAGCGTQAGLATAPMQASTAPAVRGGWGQLDRVQITVPGRVLGYAADYAEEIEREVKAMPRSSTYALRLEVSLRASRDGFRSTLSGDRSLSLRPDAPLTHDVSFYLSTTPPGEYEYFLVVTANVLERDTHRHVKTFEPRYISNHGRNFKARAN